MHPFLRGDAHRKGSRIAAPALTGTAKENRIKIGTTQLFKMQPIVHCAPKPHYRPQIHHHLSLFITYKSMLTLLLRPL